MRFVLGNRVLQTPGGTEVHLVTIGEHLQRLGHEVVVYSPQLGPFADHARDRGLVVHGALRELPDTCDVVFSQDGIVVYDLVQRYPHALSVFRVCGDVYDFQLPPQLSDVIDLVVVLSERYERLARAVAADSPVLRLRCPIDVDRLVPLRAIATHPERAVMLGNYGAREALVREVWSRNGVQVEVAGASTHTYEVAAALADADIVVAKSRAALDAMACARAVYVFDFLGGDGWVTPDRYPLLEADNFAGQATDRVIDEAALERDLADYRAGMGAANRDLVLQHHSARDHVIALLGAIGEHVPRDRGPAPHAELARLVSLQWSWEQLAREFRSDHWSLRATAIDNHHASVRAEETTRRVEAQLAQVSAERDDLVEQRDRALAMRDDTLAHAGRLDALLAESRAAHAASAGEARDLAGQLAALRATRLWRLAAAYWSVKLRLRRGQASR